VFSLAYAPCIRFGLMHNNFALKIIVVLGKIICFTFSFDYNKEDKLRKEELQQNQTRNLIPYNIGC
jgi:hypothetical protein